MGKSHRHKKLNRQEKAKTGLKGAKKLLKAANVVNPILKVKRIVIREQLNSSTPSLPDQAQSGKSVDDSLTRRHQSLPQLLSALHHHNTNIRKDALLGLHELVTGVYNHNTTLLQRNLDKILERVAALTSDLEGVVRKENLKVAAAIFCRVEELEVSPYWNLVLTHLQCTLTHLNATVRYSTLPFFHLLVSYFPNLVATSARTILTSLFGLISSSDLNRSANSPSSKATHLKVEISGRKDQVQERLKVFALIDATLQLRTKRDQDNAQNLSVPRQLVFGECSDMLVDNQEPQSDEIAIFSSVEQAKLKRQKNKRNEEEEAGLIYPFGYDTFLTRNHYSSMSLGEILGVGVGLGIPGNPSSKALSSVDDENQFWSRFASSCLSCLIETWIESCPTASGSGNNTSLASTTLEPINGSNRSKKRGSGGGDKKKVESLAKSLSSQQSPRSGGGGTSNPSVNLNPFSVDILKNLVSVIVRIISGTMAEEGNSTARNELLKVLRDTRGSELKKHFFSHLPYISIQDSQRQALTTINLQLFLLADQLGLMDEGLKRRFRALIHELNEGGALDSEQNELISRLK